MQHAAPTEKRRFMARSLCTLGALLGCLTGAYIVALGIQAIRTGQADGFLSLFWGASLVLLSLLGMGATYCVANLVMLRRRS